MDGIIKTMNIDNIRMYKTSSESYAISLDIAEQIIKRKKIPFRLSHKLVGALVNYAIKKGNTPLNLLDNKDIYQVLDKIDFLKYGINSNEILALIKDITPENSINYRTTKGSPNKDEQLIMIQKLKTKSEKYQKENNSRKKYIKDKIEYINEIVEKDYADIS
jgi:argininosuccinate lyase